MTTALHMYMYAALRYREIGPLGSWVLSYLKKSSREHLT